MSNSSAKPVASNLALPQAARPDELLREFVNLRDRDAAARFIRRYGVPRPEYGEDQCLWTRNLFRKIWERKLTDEKIEDQLELLLGIYIHRKGSEEYYERPALRVDWNRRSIRAVPRDLLDLMVVTLLVNAKRLRLCANQECPARYFVAHRTDQRYCPGDCAQLAQREHKQTWWAKHGKQWRRRQKQSHRRSKKLKGKARRKTRERR